MNRLYKKSEAGLVAILIVVIVILFFGWLVNIGQRECRINKDCGSESYCGSDFSCHTYPTIQKTVVQYNFLVPSVIIGFAIIIAAIIFRWSQSKKEPDAGKEKITEEAPVEAEEVIEPYYRSNGNIKNP